MKLIHGYDSVIDNNYNNSNNEENNLKEYNTLPFVLSEDLFIEFEQNIVVNFLKLIKYRGMVKMKKYKL